jgi:CDP-2,3-bis-(O-geranylgeranyl)-sn-glycerol synthase
MLGKHERLDHGVIQLNEGGCCMGFIGLCLLTLWLYLPGFLANTFAMMWGKWLPKTGYGPWPIDGGRTWRDGNRILGDGKTWNGLIGGSLTSGLLCVLLAMLVAEGSMDTVFDDGATVFAHPLIGAESAWFWMGGATGAAFVLGTFLGFSCLLGDSVGSFVKRRRGLKREGDVSSKAPLLDTLPFAIMVFLMGQVFLGPSVLAAEELRAPMLALIVITPLLHRSFNLIGYKIGWKDVPY